MFELYDHKLFEDGHNEENFRYDCCGSNNSQTILTHELTKFNNNFGQEGEICENGMDFVKVRVIVQVGQPKCAATSPMECT